MFQTFEATTSPEQGPPRLEELRRVMAEDGLDAYLVPRADAHQGEYVAPCDERLAWLTGFTGSAGFAVVLADRAAIFVDGRYRLQVRAQVAPVFTPVNWPETKLVGWLAEALPEGGRVGFDPWLHTVAEVEELAKARGLELVPTDNLVDRIWSDRPAPPDAPFFDYPEELAGRSAADKLTEVSGTLARAGQAAAVLTLPESIAWLLNIRGNDIPRTPAPHAFAILHADGRLDLFAAPGKARAITLPETVSVHDEALFEAALVQLTGPVRIDPATCPDLVRRRLDAAGIGWVRGEDPCRLPQARKTEAELAGARAAHLRDGAAMVRFLHWLSEQPTDGSLTEIDVVVALEGFRRATNALRDISFETICGAGPNGAIVHYRVTTETNRPVRDGELLLADSGGQYLDGTTDITRTLAIGTPPDLARDRYTRVLKGMIAMSRLRFPKGVAGAHLDAIARQPLWLAGLDYDHGTGHGVGAYLSVHEGPQGLSRRAQVALEPGMILSNEPGYYLEGKFGIRIENLIVVIPAPPLDGADSREMLAFETLTHVPLDRALIDTGLLTAEERAWIDAYHAETLAQIGPLVDGPALDWLVAACAPL